MKKRLPLAFIAASLGTIVAHSAIAQVPASHASPIEVWRKTMPATPAFLGDDGGGADQATICRTAEAYRNWVDSAEPTSCKRVARGTAVVILKTTYDPKRDVIADTILPIVKVNVPSKHLTGYLQLRNIHPVVATGSFVQVVHDAKDDLHLAPVPDADDGVGPDLSDKTEAKVLQYDPVSAGRDLKVEIVGGPNAGKIGWIEGSHAESQSGISITTFPDAFIDAPGAKVSIGPQISDAQMDLQNRAAAIPSNHGVTPHPGSAILRSGAIVCSTEKALNDLRQSPLDKNSKSEKWLSSHACTGIGSMLHEIEVIQASAWSENVHFYDYRADGSRADLWTTQGFVAQ